MSSGIIKTVVRDRGFGFISREGQVKDLFFNAKELRGVMIDELREGDHIGFDLIVGPKGPSAINVQRNGTPDEESEAEELELNDPHLTISAMVASVCNQMAHEIARNPKALDELEWRDLERLIAEAFSGLGFDVELTPASKDGGKDVIVDYRTPNGEKKSYIIEIKHWKAGKRVNGQTVAEFIHVIAKEHRTGGLFIATHGFAPSVAERLTEFDRQIIGLGTEKKVVCLCRAYVKARKGLWCPPDNLDEVIFEETA